MLRRKDSIDKLRNKAIKQLKDDNLQLVNTYDFRVIKLDR